MFPTLQELSPVVVNLMWISFMNKNQTKRNVRKIMMMTEPKGFTLPLTCNYWCSKHQELLV